MQKLSMRQNRGTFSYLVSNASCFVAGQEIQYVSNKIPHFCLDIYDIIKSALYKRYFHFILPNVGTMKIKHNVPSGK